MSQTAYMRKNRMQSRHGKRAVLGIDAAWTGHGSSGIALLDEQDDGWRLVAVEDSYHRFHALAKSERQNASRLGSMPDATELLASVAALCGRTVDLVAIDMPMAMTPIPGRRYSDNVVSKIYGGPRWGSTHTPSANRPGTMSDVLRAHFAAAGYGLQTVSAVAVPGLIEVMSG